VSVGRLVWATMVYVGVFGAVYVLIAWLECGRQPTSLLGSAAGILMPTLLLSLLPLGQLLGVPVEGVVRPQHFLVVLALGAAVVVLPLRWLARRIDGASEPEWPTPVEPDAMLGKVYRVLIVDGDCAFCRASVRWLLARDAAGRLRVAARDSAFARGVFARHAGLERVDSLLWVEATPSMGEFALTHWRAVNAAAQYLGGWPGILAENVDRLIPLRVLDAGYALVAVVRRRLPVGRACPLPDAVSAARLLS
jgi:predicted DCC family thiol-disulfide oxidoreductase YuxK